MISTGIVRADGGTDGGGETSASLFGFLLQNPSGSVEMPCYSLSRVEV